MSAKKRLSEEIKQGTIYLSVGLMTIILGSCFLYLFNLGGSSQMGYSFKIREIENNELKNENESLKLKVLRASSYNEITSQNSVTQNMQPAEPEFFETRMDRLSKK